MKKIILLLSFLCITTFCKEAEDIEEKVDQVTIGNLAVPGSQQPGSFFSIGQSIVGKGITQAYVFSSFLKACNQKLTLVAPTLLYGIDDNSAITFSIPIIANSTFETQTSRGISDTFIQYEYAFYNKANKTSNDYATVLAALTIPTGSTDTTPALGFGTPSFLVGATAVHLGYDWYYFGSLGGLFFPTNNCNCNKTGSNFLYEWGIGRNFGYKPGFICTGILEFDGVYTRPNLKQGVEDPNSGKNIIYASPSIYLATNHFILQIGCEFPIMQHLNGIQIPEEYIFAFALSWTF